jgi:hypothetical protein
MKKRFLSVASGFLAIVSCLCLVVATEPRAYAYVDPGSGFMALQAIASVMAAAGYFLRTRIKALFIRNTVKKPVKPTLVLPVNARKSDSRNAA